VHHLNHRIPFYRLHEAMRALPELQQPGTTSWRLRDIRACLALYVWDPDQERMLTYAEAR
jgi:omega-6 fatty acid desaturase (delta-12 desaturase)